MSDIVAMETPQHSRSGEEPGPQDQPLKETEGPLKEDAVPPEQHAGEKAAADNQADELNAEDEEPGTFDRVYEHGRQMGF
jgi:hypothetical protein